MHRLFLEMISYSAVASDVCPGENHMRHFQPRHRGVTARAIAAALAAITFCTLGPAHGDPGDIFSIGAPAIGSAPPKASDIQVGDSAVTSQTGAFEYSYPISVPPGRNGMQPHLALTYSSQAPIYGGIASGWTLSVPIITEDTSPGRLWSQDPAATGKRYESSMAGGRPLIPTKDAAAGDVVQTYRAQNDATFTRYERLVSGGAFWRARTTDGATYTFGAPDHTNGYGKSPCKITSDEYAPLTRVQDSFGNSVDYYYEGAVAGECRLSLITWGESQNSAAAVSEFARITLNYTIPTTCVGSYIGSQTSYRTGTKIVTGASRLDTIVVTAYPPGSPGQPLHTRTIALLRHPLKSRRTPSGKFRAA